MKADVCCIVLDCRRTGTPTAPDRPFICAKHLATVPEADRKNFAHAAGANHRARGKNAHWRFMERSTWERISLTVASQYELKPKAGSSTTTSG